MGRRCAPDEVRPTGRAPPCSRRAPGDRGRVHAAPITPSIRRPPFC